MRMKLLATIVEHEHLKTVENVACGLSYMTEDIRIAEYVVDNGFPSEFGPNSDDDRGKKFDVEDISDKFIEFYSKKF